MSCSKGAASDYMSGKVISVRLSFLLPFSFSILRPSWILFLAFPLLSVWALVWLHSLGSKGSKTVTQSSLVIGHGHANQTGRNLQLIRILPPAIIVPRHWPHSPPLHKINYILGSIPTIGFPVLEMHYREEGKKSQDNTGDFFKLQKGHLWKLWKAQEAKKDTHHVFIWTGK